MEYVQVIDVYDTQKPEIKESSPTASTESKKQTEITNQRVDILYNSNASLYFFCN